MFRRFLSIITLSLCFEALYAAPRIATPISDCCLQALDDAGIIQKEVAKEYLETSLYPFADHVRVYYYPGNNYTESNEAFYSYLQTTKGLWYTDRNFTNGADNEGRHGTEVHFREHLPTPEFWFELIQHPTVDYACKMSKKNPEKDGECITHEGYAAFLKEEEKQWARDTANAAVWPAVLEGASSFRDLPAEDLAGFWESLFESTD
ncbi:hypothetical protein BJ508DRAFT_346465 [Ascobolus immersus RN42]|uniref:Uncharacterized protein n=1 Tax=Ascobolus immersus RN42 TaxID=1160509 RepID=A0A3N4IKK6_ASCIM|nr:hypothetical protein BJ508DRAFT_346465 [Ascobolus immersus RN42]